jgi:hypothetical protein
MSGCDRPSDIQLIQNWIKTVVPTAQVDVYNDSVGALAGATFGRLYGVVLIAGTGMIAMGYAGTSATEEPKRTGGWGSFIDAGSGYSIGCAVVKAAVHDQDGRCCVLLCCVVLCAMLCCLGVVCVWSEFFSVSALRVHRHWPRHILARCTARQTQSAKLR